MGSVASRQAEPAPVAPPLVAERVSKTYDDGWHEVPVIADLSFTLDAGTIVSIVGPSGCGKTTLLNTQGRRI
jgi:NitT/TauT family transport system ATP-binding protein